MTKSEMLSKAIHITAHHFEGKLDKGGFYADSLTVRYSLERRFYGIWIEMAYWDCDLVPESVTLDYVLKKLYEIEGINRKQDLENIKRYIPAWENHRD